jgi:HEAT repeat protein
MAVRTKKKTKVPASSAEWTLRLYIAGMTPKAVDALVIALKDADADVREQAAFALGQIGDARAIDGLTAALKDANADVRQQAAFALGQIR